MTKRIVWYSVMFVLVSALAFAVQFMRFIAMPPYPSGVLQTIEIPAGDSFRKVSGILADRHIVKDEWDLKLLAYLMGATHSVKYGEYLLSGSMRPTTIIEKLLNGEVELHKVTLPEGYTDEQIAQVLEEKGLLKDVHGFMHLTRDRAFMAGEGITAETLEGFLYPETYELSRGLAPKEIIKKMINQFRLVYTPKLQERAEEMGMTMLQVVTLASIIEKETSVPSEKFLVSAVFHNRLKLGMRLQSDPTVIYAMHITNDVITKKELRARNPYNTYRIKGLPPGPICNPGMESIVAALYPANVPYLYFVANNDGSHEFSRTLKEHNHYVKLYRRKDVK
ncbi:MAG: endolytic transglycosylase MltG [Deltaproteobacteria bacterium]|nr:endolytic transglycosylase MltG [Deltaproteobacteria bacterium]MCL5277971.1 endolytic transglycosylase MltG [Deltaproteobacteria bacterium]